MRLMSHLSPSIPPQTPLLAPHLETAEKGTLDRNIMIEFVVAALK